METARDSVAFVVNDVPEAASRTRYRHAEAICDAFDATVVCGGGVPAEIERQAETTYTYSDSRLAPLPFVFPIWLLYRAVRLDADTVVVSPHGLYVLATYLGALTSSCFVVDLWDDLSLAVASYDGRAGLGNRIKALYHRLLYRCASACLRRADLVILSMYPGILDKYDLESVPVLALTNGVDPELLDRPAVDTDDEQVRVVYLGRANAKRGIDSVIRTVATTAPTAHVDVVGTTDVAVEEIASQLDNVTLHGAKPHREALWLVERADIGLCVFDTSVENYRYSYPVKAFEYAALGKAIVASDTPGIRALLTPDESAVLVDLSSEEDLQRAVETLVDDLEYRQRLGHTARDEIAQYIWPAVLERYTDGIEAVSASGSLASSPIGDAAHGDG